MVLVYFYVDYISHFAHARIHGPRPGQLSGRDPSGPAQQILNTILLLDNDEYNCFLFLKKMQIPTKKRLQM